MVVQESKGKFTTQRQKPRSVQRGQLVAGQTIHVSTPRLLQIGSRRDRYTKRGFGRTQLFTSRKSCFKIECPRHGRAAGVALCALQDELCLVISIVLSLPPCMRLAGLTSAFPAHKQLSFPLFGHVSWCTILSPASQQGHSRQCCQIPVNAADSFRAIWQIEGSHLLGL